MHICGYPQELANLLIPGSGLPPLVSVIIPAYNAGTFIRHAIDSALSQSYPNLEVIVTDDGSTDETPEILQSYGVSIKVVRQANRGLAAARNAAMRHCSGQYVAFLDADDAWHPMKVARQVELLEELSEHVLVHTAIVTIDGGGTPKARVPKSWHRQKVSGFCTDALLVHNTITVSSVLVRRAALEAEPFRPGIQGCEDWDLWLRLSLERPIAYIDEPLTCYRIHGDNMSGDSLRMLTASIDVLSGFVRRPVSVALRRVARRQLRLAWLDRANHAYQQGRMREARELFLKASAVLDWPSVLRLLASVVPNRGRTIGRQMRQVFRKVAGRQV